ncbi:MAG: hypothetical protein D6722_01345, partial [Bacteroidetes bacterium]
MKRWALIACLFGLLLPWGSGIWLQWERYQWQRQLRRQLLTHLDARELVVFALDAPDQTQLRWEHEGEFRYRGRWYDVVHRRQAGDSLYLWVWPDVTDTALDQQARRLTAWLWGQDIPRQQDQQRWLSTWLQAWLLPAG